MHPGIPGPGIVLEPFEALQERIEAPLVAALQVGQLVARHGHRNAEVGTGAQGKGAHRGGAMAIAQVVDEDLPLAIPGAHLGSEELGQGVGQVLGGRLGEGLDGVPILAPIQGHHQVQTAAAAGLDERLEVQLVEQGQHQLRRFHHARPGQGGIGVEIEDEAGRN